MNQLDFRAIRRRISIRSVLGLLGYEPVIRRGSQWRGPCPMCRPSSAAESERCFSCDIRRNLFRCFRCGRSGNQLDLWCQLSGLSLYPATLDLCRRLSIDAIPIENPQPRNRP